MTIEGIPLPPEVAAAIMSGRGELIELLVNRMKAGSQLTLTEQISLLRFCATLINARGEDRRMVVELQRKLREYVRNLRGGIDGIDRLVNEDAEHIGTDDGGKP